MMMPLLMYNNNIYGKKNTFQPFYSVGLLGRFDSTKCSLVQ